jgi:hypothetical protein
MVTMNIFDQKEIKLPRWLVTLLGLLSLTIILAILVSIHIKTDIAIADHGERLRCRMYKGNPTGAQAALKAGATYLDANHDGIACNAIK